MAYSTIHNVQITGIACCVPKSKVDNLLNPIFSTNEEAEKFVQTTGVRFKRYAEDTVCASDLCEKAARQLMIDLNIKPEEIDVVILITQTPDYPMPNTAILLQDRLRIPKSSIAFDIPLGCSGYVYGLFTLASILSATKLKRGLLLAGDTLCRQVSPKDKTSYPLFGDAGSASIVEFTDDTESKLDFLLGSDGSGYQSIIIPAGGHREPVTCESLNYSSAEDGIERNRTNLVMNGTSVFTFGLGVVSLAIKDFFTHFGIEKEQIDFAYFHQANKFMNEKIRKKVGLTENQVPYSLQEYGNTTSATIPLTISLHSKTNKLQNKQNNLLLCGFGVGLSWGVCRFTSKNLFVADIIEY